MNIDIEKLKEVLAEPEIEKLINENRWQEVYDVFSDKYGGYGTENILTDVLLKSGIDPLPYMQTIHTHMYDGLDLYDIVVPEDITFIGQSAFEKCIKLKRVEIKGKVKKIDSYCFYDCENLEEVILPDGVESIGFCCFLNCKNLKNINLPDTVKFIGYRAFSNCENLASIIIPDSFVLKPNMFRSGSLAIFDGCDSLKSITWRGKTYKSRNEIAKELEGDRFKASNTWYRVKNYGRSLVCYETKKGIKCNMVLDGFINSDQCPVFFRSKAEAEKFLRNNNNVINGWKAPDSAVYQARLSSNDTGFVKVKTEQGDVYVQNHKAYNVGAQNNPVIPA